MQLVPFEALGDLGIMPDTFARDLPAGGGERGSNTPFAWSAAQNFRFRDGFAEKLLGHTAINGTPQVVPYGLFPVYGVNGRYWVYMGLQQAYAVNNLTHTNITRGSGNYTGTTANKWNGGDLSGTLVVNNGIDNPQYWGGNVATPMADLLNWPANTQCKVMRPFKQFLMALNVTKSGTNYPHMVKWSTEAVPGTLPASWDQTDPTQDAGEQDLADTEDHLVDGLALGDTFMIYKENSTYAAQFIGQPYIFRFACISKESGILATNCVAAFPGTPNFPMGGHAIMTQGDIVVTNGISPPQSIADRRMRKAIFNNLDSTNYANSFAVENPTRNEIWFCYPTSGSVWCNQAAIWNYKDNTWGVRDIPNLTHANAGVIVYAQANTWDVDTDAWDNDDTTWGEDDYTQAASRVMMADSGQLLHLADITRSFNGSPMTASIERTGLDFGMPERIKTCRGVRLRIDADAGTVIQVYVGQQADLSQSVTWNGPYNFTVGSSVKVDCFVSARYLSVKFVSVAQGAWRVRSFDMDVGATGMY